MSYKARFYFLLLFSLPLIVLGQVPAPKIEVGPDRISMREQLKVTLTVYGAKYTLDDFPELGGFTRGNRTVKHGEVVIDGKKTEAHFITKSYVPIEGGEFTILPFEIEVNQKPVRFEGKKIWVEDDEEGYADFVGDIDDAELVTECSKKEIFVGEGVKVRVSFYLSNNAGNWQFPADIGNQVETLAKRLKPENSLENRNVISNITARVEYIKGKKYSVYDLFEAVYYPLNNHHIDIPALTLKMSKGTGSESLKTKAQVIKVKELPEHPLREKVPVGILRLRENLEGGKQKATGESFDLRFTLEGQANMGSLNFGKIESDSNLDFFESSVNVQQENGKVAGAKTFVFKVLPKVAGDYDLGKYFNLVYFDIKTARYDTLSAKETILVTGKTIQGKESLKQDIYSGIENLKTDANDFNVRRFLKVFANFILVFMVMFLIFIWKKKNE